jgi:hypothetical protein
MSTGGVFQLIVNDGNQDKMLMATQLLNKRLKEIKRIRCKNPAIKDTTPTLVDIERTHILYMNAHFKPFVAIGYEYQKIGVQEGSASFGDTVTFSIPQFGDFFNDMAVHVVLENLTVGTTSTQVRYCDFIGHRLFKRVRFEVNNIKLDEYTSDTYNFHYNFTVPESKRMSWKRNVGQEIPIPTYLIQDPLVDEYRELKFITEGPQTPKVTHPRVEMWIPLLFWFNTDPRLAIPSVSIPYGQRFMKIELAEAAEIARGFDTPDFTAPAITIMDLYTNNIFVNPEIHDIFIRRIGFNLIRVHRQDNVTALGGSEELRLDQLKFPTETLYFGLRPDINLTGAENMTDWHRYHFVTDVFPVFPVAIPNPGIPPPTHILAFSTAIYKRATPTIDTAAFETHGIELYRVTPAQFYNSYIPYTFGGPHVSSPDDIGMYMATFNLYPGSYQPSGHVNLSRTREFFMRYTSTVITPLIPATMIVIGIAINFLLISDGSAVLRYNT